MSEEAENSTVAPEPAKPVLNIANINRLIAKLKSLESPEKFRMSTYGSFISFDKAYEAERIVHSGYKQNSLYHECNTACCIAGWANFIYLTEDIGEKADKIYLDDLGNSLEAMNWLGIDDAQARQLFAGHWSANVQQGIKVLELLIETGDVKWGEAINGPFEPLSGDPLPVERHVAFDTPGE